LTRGSPKSTEGKQRLVRGKEAPTGFVPPGSRNKGVKCIDQLLARVAAVCYHVFFNCCRHLQTRGN